MEKITRRKNYTWLIGHPCENIIGARLPCGRAVMQNFVHFHKSQKLNINRSALLVYEQLMPFWNKTRLPTQHKSGIIKKIKALYQEHVCLARNKCRSNHKDCINQNKYRDKLEKLFDISHAQSDILITNEVDRTFLKLQQTTREGYIGPIDKKFHSRESRSQKRKERLAMRHINEMNKTISLQRTESSSSSSDNDDVRSDSCIEFKMNARASEKRKKIVSSSVSAVLDRTNISIRKAAMITASVLNEAGCSTTNAVLSKSTVHRLRQQNRREIGHQIRKEFKASKSVVHWDGKLLPDVSLVCAGLVERLPVCVSSLVDGRSKLLGVPKLMSGTGKASANAVIENLKLWNCDSDIIGMCYDSASVNTGKITGACKTIETTLGRDLLWLTCRHHMFEVLLADIFKLCLTDVSTGPEIVIFKKFKDNWTNLNHHQPILQDRSLIAVSNVVKNFVEDQLKLNQSRNDYRELIELAAMMIGLKVKFNIRKPGAMHRARWMMRAIYSLKIQLLYAGNEKVINITKKKASRNSKDESFYCGSVFTIMVYCPERCRCPNQ